jgi:selT/selW/selH-like putative selenoprotein
LHTAGPAITGDRCQSCQEIEAETGIKPVLVHSPDIGAFEVSVNDELIFSKSAAGRFPEFTKIIDAVKGKMGSSE